MGNLKERLESGELILPTEAEVKAEFCAWIWDECHEKWDTDCLEAHCFFEGGPTDNHYVFCPYCGKHIDIID